jgi:WD40 repeat protein
MSQSPEGDAFVTGAGDEMLKFWKIFPKVHLLIIDKKKSHCRKFTKIYHATKMINYI